MLYRVTKGEVADSSMEIDENDDIEPDNTIQAESNDRTG